MSPSSFIVRYRAPWSASIATVVTPKSSAKGESISTSVMEMLPSASRGTPRMMLPNVTPNRSAMPNEEAEKTMSHPVRHSRPGSLLRNSIATARTMSATSRNIMAR